MRNIKKIAPFIAETKGVTKKTLKSTKSDNLNTVKAIEILIAYFRKHTSMS